MASFEKLKMGSSLRTIRLNDQGQMEVTNDKGETTTLDLPEHYYTKEQLGSMYVFFVKPASDANEGDKVWTAVSATRYKVVVSGAEAQLIKPYIEDCVVYNEDGTGDKTVLEAIELLNGDLVIYSNLEITCKIILRGE